MVELKNHRSLQSAEILIVRKLNIINFWSAIDEMLNYTGHTRKLTLCYNSEM